MTPATLGAWLIKCNPRKTALDPMLAAGVTNSSWCVADNYRSQLMRAGQRVLFWVTGHPQRGIWGAGLLDGGLWAEHGQLHIPVRIPLLPHPITAAELTELPELRGMEVFRSPQQANPSWVTLDELAAIDRLLPGG